MGSNTVASTYSMGQKYNCMASKLFNKIKFFGALTSKSYVHWPNVNCQTSLNTWCVIGVFPKWSRTFIKFSEFVESDKSLKQEQRWRDPVSHVCLAGAVVASLSLTQEVAGSSPFTVMTNILSLNLLNSVKTFRNNFSTCWVTQRVT